MLLKLVLIFCLLISLSWAINVEVESYTYSKDAGMPDKLVHSSVNGSGGSGSGGSGSGGSSGTSSGCGTSSGTGYNDGDTTVNDGVTYKSSELKQNLQETGCYSTGDNNDTGTGSGRSSTTVNDGVTYKATDILQAKTSTTYYY
ncbi:hypothetical protein ACTFIY_005377 [Dictyostelium cf. discoideum]